MSRLSIALPSGGLVVDRPAEYIDAHSISNGQNIEIIRNIVQQRKGGAALGVPLGERILGQGELETGLDAYFVRVGLTKAQVINKSTLAWTDIHNVPLTASAEESVYFAYPLIAANRVMVYTNGVDRIRKFTGTGNDANLGGTPPIARFLIDFKGYLVLGYVVDAGTTYFARVQWSDTGDTETWIGGNSGSVNLLEDSLEITGISRFGDFLAVHKESAIYLGQLVTSSEVFRFTRKETGAGTISQGSIQNLPDGTQIFLARDGLRIFNGVSSSLIPSSIISELRDSVNPQWVKRATSVLVKDLDEYWIGIPIGSQEEPETVYKYNYRTGNVYKDTRIGLMSLALYRRLSQDAWDDDSESWDSDTTRWDSTVDLALHRQVVLGYDDGLSILRSSSANDNDVAIDSIWDTKDFNASDIDENLDAGNLIRWKGLQVWATGGFIIAYYSTDSGSTWNTIGTLTLTSDYPEDDDDNNLYLDVLSSKIRFRFRNADVGSTWALKQYVIDYTVREARK